MNKLEQHLENYNKFKEFIAEIIDYPIEDLSEGFEVWDKWWNINDDELKIITEEDGLETGEYYDYTISSYRMKGEKLYMGEYEDYVIVMAYPDSEMWDNTIIYILNKNKQIKE